MNLIKTKLFHSVLIALVLPSLLLGCSQKSCKIEDREVTQAKEEKVTMSTKKDLTKRVYIYKPDGSLQCGQGQKISTNVMSKELSPIQIFSSENKNDGLMRIQVCGQPTGYCNVYEILEDDLQQATQLGFKKWIRD